jgi:hypothetical protein
MHADARELGRRLVLLPILRTKSPSPHVPIASRGGVSCLPRRPVTQSRVTARDCPASHTETCDSASAGRCAVQCVDDVTFRFGRGVAFVCEGPARGQRGRHRPTHQPSEAQRERTTFEAAVRGAVGGVRSAGIDS